MGWSPTWAPVTLRSLYVLIRDSQSHAVHATFLDPVDGVGNVEWIVIHYDPTRGKIPTPLTFGFAPQYLNRSQWVVRSPSSDLAVGLMVLLQVKKFTSSYTPQGDVDGSSRLVRSDASKPRFGTSGPERVLRLVSDWTVGVHRAQKERTPVLRRG